MAGFLAKKQSKLARSSVKTDSCLEVGISFKPSMVLVAAQQIE
jgi:hypothetical protein